VRPIDDFESSARRPSRVFKPEEVHLPGFLPDLPATRKEYAQYLSSTRRADDVFGAVLDELEAAGLAQSTLVVFLSDHGPPLPFAKSNCWQASTHTPLIVRWPGRVQAGTVDGEHLVSALDLMPTLLAAAGVALPEGLDGVDARPHDWRLAAAFIDTYNATYGLQSVELKADSTFFQTPTSKRRN